MIRLLTGFFDISSYLVLMVNFLDKKKVEYKKIPLFIFFIIVQLICCFVPIVFKRRFLLFVLNILSMAIPAYFYFKIPLKKFFFCTVTSYAFITTVQLPFAIFLSMHFPNISENAYYMLGCVYTLAMIIILSHFLKFDKLYTILYESKKIGYIAIINSCLVMVIIVFFFRSNVRSLLNVVLYFTFSLALLIISNIVVYNQLFTISKQKKQLQAYEEYMPILKELIMSVRQKQHNHTNEMQSIISLMYIHKDYETLTESMSQMLDISLKKREPDYLLKLNLLLVSGFLYQKHMYAINNNRNIVFSFDTYKLDSQVPEYHLVEMFGILIDNALEAIPEGESIYVSVSSENNTTTFTTRNSGWILNDEDYTNFFTNGYTKKPEFSFKSNHSGLGLYYLKQLVLYRYKGKLALWNEDTDIVFQITV